MVNIYDECFECGEEKELKYISGNGDGYINLCSLKCAKKYIQDNWKDFVQKDGEEFE